MSKPILTFGGFAPLFIQQYERYLPTAFDESMSILQKMNKIIMYLNQIGATTDSVVSQWNEIMEWVVGDGLNATLTERLDAMVAEGAFADILTDNLFDNLVGRVNDSFDEKIALLQTEMDSVTENANTKVSYDGLRYIDAFQQGIAPDTGLDVTLAIQNIFDTMPNGAEVEFKKGVYIVSKNSALLDFPHNDQPCLLIRGKKDITIKGEGAIFKVNTHAQGILEVQLCERLIFEGITFNGYGLFPGIDHTTGYSEKGTETGGYHTSGFWTYYKNNCNDTSQRDHHGALFGTFGGGYIGNVSYGLLIHRASKNITVENCHASGFNYSGFGVGHKGTSIPTELNYADSLHVSFIRCTSKDNYSSNFSTVNSEYTSFENCVSERAGHPDSNRFHTYSDPGYGFAMHGSMFGVAKHTSIIGCKSLGDKRKGIDAHTGHGLIARDNIIKDTNITGIYYNTTNKDQKSYDYDISNNKLYGVGRGNYPSSAISVGGVDGADYSYENAYAVGKINNNLMVDCFGVFGIIHVAVYDNLQIMGNTIKRILARDKRTNQTYKPAGIYFGYSLVNELNHMGMCKDNIIDGQGYVDLVGGIIVRNLQEGSVSGNVIKLDHIEAQFGIQAFNCKKVNFNDNMVVFNDVGIPYNLDTTGSITGNDSKGGNATVTPLTGNLLHFRLSYVNGVETLNTFTGGQYLKALSTDADGMMVTLRNTQIGIKPATHVVLSGSNGLTTNGGNVGYLYPKTLNEAYVLIGSKETVGGTNVPKSAWYNGAIDVMITV